MNQYTVAISHEEYKNFCEDFFVGILSNAQSITEHVSHMTVQEYQAWRDKLIGDYYESKQQLIRDVVAQMRKVSDEELQKKENQDFRNGYRNILDGVLHERVFELNVIKELEQKLLAHAKQEAYERSLEVQVQGHEFKAIAKCDVYWTGWECDNTAWVVVHDGQNKLVTTNHGGASFTDKSFLEGKIKEYEEAIANTRQMLQML